MYTPKIPEDLVRRLYRLKQQNRKPMTVLVAEAIEIYLNEQESKISKGGKNDTAQEA